MFAATTDVKDCFHRMKAPSWMHPFFSLSPLATQDLYVVGRVVDGIPHLNSMLVHPRAADEVHLVPISGTARRRETLFRLRNREKSHCGTSMGRVELASCTSATSVSS